MALSLLPTPTELAGLDSVDAVRNWTGLPNDTWQAFSTAMGGVASLRVLAATPADIFRSTLRLVRIPVRSAEPRELGSVECIQLALMWRVSRQAFQLPDVDVLAPGSLIAHPPAAAAPAAPGGSPLKKLKISNFADQLDDTEIEMITKDQLDEAYAQFREVTGADPQPEADPSAEQIAVMRVKIVENGEPPYGDFSVLTPYGRRVQKAMKAKHWLLQQDGSWKAQEVPGPPSFAAWCACWRVFRTVLLMLCHKPAIPGGPRLPVATVACLEEYFDKVKELNDEYPEAWHLLMLAEDRCRGEHLDRLRRVLSRALLEGRLPMGLRYSENQPWVGVITQAARDTEYWQKHVVRPAQNFIARGGAGRAMSKETADGALLSDAAQQALHGADRPAGEGVSRSARRRRAAKERAEKEKIEKQSSTTWKPGGAVKESASPNAMVHPRKFGKMFITTREGVEICYRFAKGASGACGEPCADKRAHVCQYCLGAHSNQACSVKNGGGGKGSSKSK